MQLSPGEVARRIRVSLEANLLLDWQQLVGPESGSRGAGVLGSHVIGDGARRTLRGQFQHQRAPRTWS